MLVHRIPNNSQINFKAIQLNEAELKKSDNLLQSLLDTSVSDADTIKIQLFELYNKHLEKEINLKSKSHYIKEDFSQKLFLHFFEALENIRKKLLDKENFLSVINNIKPTKDELKSGIAEKSINSNINNSNLTLENLLTDANIPQYLSSRSDKEKKFFELELNKILNNPVIKDIEKIILADISESGSIQATAKKMGVSRTTINRYYQRAINKIQNENNILPQKYNDLAYEINNKFNINDIEKIKNTLMNDPYIVNYDKGKLFQNIKTSSAQFKITEEDFVKAGLKQPQLLYQNPETLKIGRAHV